MKKTVVRALVVATLSFVVCQPAFAGSSSDAALGLGAFAVFNQLFGGFGAVSPAVVAQPSVVYAPPPPVVYAPPPVVYAPPPVTYYPPPPPPVVVYQNGYAYSAPRYYYRAYRKHHHDEDEDDDSQLEAYVSEPPAGILSDALTDRHDQGSFDNIGV